MKKWISNGAEYSFQMQLIHIHDLLNKFLLVIKIVDPRINDIGKTLQKSDLTNIEADDLNIERLKLYKLNDYSFYEIYNIIDVAKILMCIDLEMRINKFCYYNLNNDVFEAIEKLDTISKMIISTNWINLNNFKGSKQYEYIREFKNFRNSYAHGKISEITLKKSDDENPKKINLKDNRISDDKYKTLFDVSLLEQTSELIKLCNKFINLINYLNRINTYKDDDIFDISDKNNIEFFIISINKICNIIHNDLDLDSDTKLSLDRLLDRLLGSLI